MYENTLTQDQVFPQEKFSEDEIHLDADDTSNRYTIVPNALIRDETISPNCRWLIIYLISNKPGWTIKTNQLVKHTKGFIGRDKMGHIINEAIKAGYMKREDFIEKQEKGGLRRYKYTVSSTPKFKNSLRNTDLQDPELQDPEDQGTKVLLSEELLSLRKEKNKQKSRKEKPIAVARAIEKPKNLNNFPEEAKKLADEVIDYIKQSNPDYLPPENRSALYKSADYMLRVDNRDYDKIIDIVKWILQDHFWCDKILKKNPLDYLRKEFPGFSKRMSKPSGQERKFAPSSDDDEALRIMKEMTARAI